MTIEPGDRLVLQSNAKGGWTTIHCNNGDYYNYSSAREMIDALAKLTGATAPTPLVYGIDLASGPEEVRRAELTPEEIEAEITQRLAAERAEAAEIDHAAWYMAMLDEVQILVDTAIRAQVGTIEAIKRRIEEVIADGKAEPEDRAEDFMRIQEELLHGSAPTNPEDDGA
ncbi:hypothetical protein [Sagittula salina]|uniref:Uncharacterized protein n=1 Tax=Sagittula salina TaxID=2820268 RepID=A0A940MNC0_9RHOB|nr:hypothetical protein [Sagittula salina]MBP0484661.1 hypothetical protein [Sagittula salina]